MNCNHIIDYWLDKNKKFYSFLRSSLGKNISLPLADNQCLVLALSEYNYLTKYQQCKQCQLVSRFLDKNPLSDNDEFEIKYGRKKGEKIYFIRSNYQDFDIILHQKNKERNLLIMQGINKFILDSHVKENIYYYITRNKYLNLALIYNIMQTIGKAKNFPSCPQFLTFFTCRDKIALLYTKHEINEIKELLNNPLFISQTSPTARKKKNNYLTSNVIEDIWKQLTIFFLFYQKFYFCHNQANIEFLKIDCELNNFIFMGKEIISPIKLYISPSFYSAINMYHSEEDIWARFNYHRYEGRHATNLVESWYIGWDGEDKIERKIFAHSLPDFEKGKIMYYLLGKEADKFLYFRRNEGSMIMYKSFDILCFLVSLMIEDYIFVSVKNSKKLNSIWTDLWLKEELEELEEDIKNIKKNNFDNVFALVRNYHLRVDALDYLNNKLI